MELMESEQGLSRSLIRSWIPDASSTASILPSWKILWTPIPDLSWSLAGFPIHKNANFCHFGSAESHGKVGAGRDLQAHPWGHFPPAQLAPSPIPHPNVVVGLIPEEAMKVINSLCLIITIISILITKWSHAHISGVPLAPAVTS